MIALLNPQAAGGTALRKWDRIATEVQHRAGLLTAAFVEEPERLPGLVTTAIDAGHRTLLAGGGDGTVNAVAAAVIECPLPEAREVILGAVGLGSSNDFHKPFRLILSGVPCRIDRQRTRLQDVGRLRFVDPEGRIGTRYWLVNASLGVTADANVRFNTPTPVLGFLKRTSTSLAIAYAAAAALLCSRGEDLEVTVDETGPARQRLRNLAFVKNPHFAGALRYDTPVDPQSGRFAVHAVNGVSRPRLMLTLAGLARGRFTGSPGTWSREAGTARVSADRPFTVEFDGEVIEAVRLEVSLLPRRLRVCQ